jgi:DNA-binding winged helix-turn-helix (wHTH) protein/Tol biopolymer transport system component
MSMDARAGRRRFGDFEFDPEAGTLFEGDRRVRIQPQPLAVLAILVDRAGEVVSREELQRTIWDQATYVEFDQGLNYCIRQIRQALRDDAAKPTFVETLKKRGYRFIALVDQKGGGLGASAATVVAPPVRRRGQRWAIPATVAAVLVVALVVRALVNLRPTPVTYTQVTSFSDAAFAPAVSPDGRMIAFMVGSDASFPPFGEIYTKLLPSGEPVQRTHDSWPKYGVAFSPDGSQITYTVADASHGWSTAALAALGGEPQPFVPNAAGLSWLDGQHVLFSEIKSGLHMGLVTATTSRSNVRDVYLPKHERGMAHYAYASPDRSWVLVVEMGPTGAWEPCRLLPFDGSSAGSQVGPAGSCTSAAWSPDGAWMYFTARVQGTSHLWRQRFPRGELEQLTSGPGEEDGVALGADGRSLLTSVGMKESGVWMHDATGDHLISSDGYASGLAFSRDGEQLYYLLRRASMESSRELWVADLSSGKSRPVVRGFDIESFDVSSDGRQVVLAVRPPAGLSQLWLASCDGHSAPRLLASSGEGAPFFGPDDDILYGMSDGANNFLFRMKLDGSTRAKVLGPIIYFKGVSPDRRWAVAMVPVAEVPSTAIVAVSLRDGAVKRICPAQCMAQWSPDGTRFYVEPLLQAEKNGLAIAIPVPKGASLPDLPASGVSSSADAALLRGSTLFDLSTFDPAHDGGIVAPGLAPETFAYTKTISHRNLFQVRLP